MQTGSSEAPVAEEGDAALEAAEVLEIPEWVPEPIAQGLELANDNPLLGFLFFIVLALVGAKVSEWLLCRVLAGLARRTATDLDDRLIEAARRPVFIAVFFTGLALAVRTLPVDPEHLLPVLRLLGLVVAVAVSFLVARCAEIVICHLLHQVASRTATDLDDRLIELIAKPIFITVLFTGLAFSIRSLRLPVGFTETTENVLQTIGVLVWLRAGFPFCGLLLEGLGRLKDRFTLIEERTIPLFDITTKLLLVGGASYAVLLIWSIDPTAWLASAGVIGIAVGFAAKDTLANLFGGFFIVADTPYKLGDFVILDSGERGMVTNVGIRSTRLETRDDVEVTIPNAMIANAKIINESGGKWVKERIRIKIGVAYGSDVDQVCEVLKAVAETQDHVCPQPSPRVRMRGFGDSSLDFELLCWIDEPVQRGKLTHELNMAVYKALNKAQIEIPYPKRDVYLHRVGDDGE